MDEVLFSSKFHDWETPEELFQSLDDRWVFGVDVAASAANTKCARWFGPQGEHGDALDPSLFWPTDTPLWMNPPYDRRLQGRFVRKAVETAVRGGTVVALLPSRTDTKVFHTCVWDEAVGRPHPWVQSLDFVRGRLQFVGAEAKAPFPSMVVVFSRERR